MKDTGGATSYALKWIFMWAWSEDWKKPLASCPFSYRHILGSDAIGIGVNLFLARGASKGNQWFVKHHSLPDVLHTSQEFVFRTLSQWGKNTQWPNGQNLKGFSAFIFNYEGNGK